MVMGELAESTDVLVIGGGPAGYVAAIRAAQLGRQVTVVEKEGLGGLCLFHGCIPSKALIHAADALEQIQRYTAEGISVDNARIDYNKTQDWKAGVIKQLNSGIQFLFKQYGIETVYGSAYFESPTRVGIATEAGVRAFEFRSCIIATGSSSRKLKELAFDGTTIISSREALALRDIPKSIAIFGGGYIGCELGFVFAKIGSQVTIVEHGSKILAAADPEASAIVQKRLEELGVKFYFNSKAEDCVVEGGMARVKFSPTNTANGTPGAGGEVREMQVEKVLVAIGNVPNTSSELGLDKAGIALDNKGFITVDSQMRTSVPTIYAVGDVVGHPMLAHKASAQARIAAEVVAGKDVIYDKKVVPAVVFTDPEIASVGLQEHEAHAQGKSVAVGKFPFRALGRALASNKPSGFVKIIADGTTHAVLGGTIVGAGASDLIAEIALAAESGLLLEDVAATIHVHPTFAEAVGEAAEDALGEAIHLPKKK